MSRAAYSIIATITTPTPEATALLFCGCLGADKGVRAEVRAHGAGFIVIADDGRAVVFAR